MEANQRYKYFIYCRKSNGKEADASPSINAQYSELIAYAQRENLNIADVYKEVQSAFKTGRPKLAEMIERIKDGDANGILIWEVSRLSRNMQDASTIDTLKKEKRLLSIRTPTKEYIDEDGEDFLYSMELVISRQYSKEISKRVRRGLKYKISNGEWPGGAPLGYINFNRLKAMTGLMTPERRQKENLILEKCEKENRELRRTEMDPVSGNMLKKVFEDFSTGNYSIAKMQDNMNEMGLMGKGGKPVSKNCLINALQNPFYYGMIEFGDSFAEGKHEPLISKTLFDKVQEALRLRNRPLKRRKGRFEFTGLIKCGECGCGITGYEKTKHNKYKGKTTYTYYGCTHMRDRARRIPCKQTATTGKDLKKQLEKQVRKVQINDMVKELLAEALKRSYQTEKELHSKGLLEWQNMYRSAENKIEKLFELYDHQAITIDEFKTKKEEILNDKQKAKEHLDSHGSAQKAWLNYSEKLIVTTDHVLRIFKQGNPEEVKMLMNTIGKNFVLEDGVVRFLFKEPYNYLAQLHEIKSSNKSDMRERWDSNPRSPP